MKYLLLNSLAALLLGAPAWGQTPAKFSKIPVLSPTKNRIVEGTSKSPYVERGEPDVEAFVWQSTLDERQQLMLDGTLQAQTYAVQPTSNTQSVNVAQPIAAPPRHAESVGASTIPSDCDCVASKQTLAPRRQWRRLMLEEQCASARDMAPHCAYQSPYGGAYYFRPYMAEHIRKQAGLMGNWTGNSANPYDNRFLQAVYDEPRE